MSLQLCTVTGTLYDPDGSVARNGTPLTIQKVVKTGAVITLSQVTVYVTGGAGGITFTVPRACSAWLQSEAYVGGTSLNKNGGVELAVPNAATATLESLGASVTGPTTGLTLQDEGLGLPGLYSTFNFVGSGVAVTQQSPGVALVTITGAVASLDDLSDVMLTSPANNDVLTFNGSAWVNSPAGSGSGSVTSFSAGNLSPLFTSSVANPASTPALSFALSTQAANRIFAGPSTGSAAAPTFRALVAADIPNLSSVYQPALGFTAESVANKATDFSTLNNSLYPTVQAVSVFVAANYQPLSSNLTTFAAIAPSANVQTLLGSANFAAFRSSLGVAIGSNVQAWDADLDAIAALSGTSGLLKKTAANTWTLDTSIYATQAYADALVMGLLDDRGNFDASGNVFPSSGGSGSAGAILKGDLWTISVAGTLGGVAVTAGDIVRALADSPGQTAGNWAISENNIGYAPLNAALASGKFYVGNGSGIGTAVTPTGDVTFDNAGVFAIGAGKVSNAMLAGGIAYSKLNLTGAILNADLAGSIDLTSKVTGALPLANGGTGQITKAAAFDALSPLSASGDILYGGTSGTGTRLAKGSDGQVLTLASGLPTWATPAGGSSNPFDDGMALVKGSGDATKLLRFEVDGFTTGTTRVITPPNADTIIPIATQQITWAGLTAARTLTLPDAAATLARTDAGQTFTGVNVFTSPKILTDISDTNGNELLKFTSTAEAVNEFTVANAATGANPVLSATGGDTNIGLTLTPKGSGSVLLNLASNSGMLQFGAATSAAPALTYSGTLLKVVLADFSTDAPIQASVFRTTNSGGFAINGVGATNPKIIGTSAALPIAIFVNGTESILAQVKADSYLIGGTDALLSRITTSVIGITNNSTAGSAFEFVEMTAPGTPGSDKLRLYAEDNGSGKTRLVIKWSDGTTTVLGTQP